MYNRKAIYTFIILFGFFNTYAQHYNFKGISVEQGLPRSGAYSLLQDAQGYLWITMDGGGVARYDGKNFKSIDLENGLPSRKVRAIYQDTKDNLWFGTTEGLCRYKNDSIKTFTTKDGLSHNYIRSITEDITGNIIIGTNKGVCKLTDDEITTLIGTQEEVFESKIRILYRDKKDKVWIGSKDGLYFIDYEGHIQRSKLNNQIPSTEVLSIENDTKGNLWIGTENGVIKKGDSASTIFNTDYGLIGNRVRAICEDQVGNIWIGTRLGVSCLTNNQIINFNKNNGLTHERIRDITMDKNGNLWFATYYGGINCFNPRDFVTYSKKEGLIGNQVLSFNQSSLSNRIIAGTFDGISTFNLENGIIKNIENYSEENGLLDNRTYFVYEDSKQTQWIGSKDGICITKDFIRFIPIKNELFNLDSEIYTIIEESENVYWAGGEDGLFKITFNSFPNDFKIEHLLTEIIPAADISSLAKDKHDNIWIGYRHGNIIIKSKENKFYAPNFNIPINNISTIISDEKFNTWVGTDAQGLFRIDHSEDLTKEIEPINYTKNKYGLTSNNIYSISVDKNKVWLGSEKGVDKVTLDKNNNVFNVKHYGKNEGITGGEILEKSKLLMTNGNLCLGTVKGIAVTSPIPYKEVNKPPSLSLINFQARSSDNSIIKTFSDVSKPVIIEYYNNNISIDFIGIDLNSPKKVVYKWILDGYSDSWSKETNRNFLNFTNLPSGKYKLKIISASADGVWNVDPLIIKFKIRTPFWESIWFILLMLLLVGYLIYLTFKWKTKKLLEKQLKLEEKISEAVKTIEEEKIMIEQQNSKINNQKEKLEEQHKEIKQSIDYAQLIQEASLPEQKITEILPDSFLYYNPRDIVSGDFYWWNQKEDIVLFCVADSTGHGIPGAFISLIGTILSNEIFFSKKLTAPNEILDELNKTIQLTLEQHLPNPKIKDGMDLAFCVYHKNDKKIYFSGANNPMWLVRHNNQKLNHNGKTIEPNLIIEEANTNLYEIKGDKQPIGLHAVKQHPFTLNEIDVQEGDEIYIFTDGYADQFGGEKNKKYMSKRFKKLVSVNENIPMQTIKQHVENSFNDWKGSTDQVDDVCVVGVRI